MLTEAKIKALRPGARLHKVFDGDGLYLLVHPSGAMTWRMRYQFDNTDRSVSFGEYPGVKLADARARRNEARVLIQRDTDPIEVLRLRKQRALAAAETKSAAGTFESTGREFWAEHSKGLSSATKIRDERIQKKVYKLLGTRPIAQLKPADVRTALHALAATGFAETAHRAFAFIRRVVHYSLSLGVLEVDVTSGLDSLLPKVVEQSHAAITDPKEFGQLLRAIAGYDGEPATVAALKLLPLVFTRYGELRLARWSEVDLESAQWVVPAERMKSRQHDHIVPLSRQAIEIFEWLKPITHDALDNTEDFVFPALGRRGRPQSENTVGAALRVMGYTGDRHVAHGFRTSASTLLHEHGFDSAVIELQLAHTDGNKIRAIYNRSARLQERRSMMQEWADYLDLLRDGAKVVSIAGRR